MLLNIKGMAWQRYEHVASITTPRIPLTQGKFDFTVFEHCKLQGLHFDKIPSICGRLVFFCVCVCVLFPDHVATCFPHITSLFYIPFQAEYAFHVIILYECVIIICFDAVCTLMIYHIGFELGSR